ncbi:MAG: phosphoglycolate phosphatase [Alphaproteobacteria bacterium]|nr:phosphoglycolate phosphatase [Alphaproteobacteria bacterium]
MSPIVIFDLDGTLVDTAPDLAASLNAAMAQFSIQPLSTEAIRPLIGAGSRALVARGFAAAGRMPSPEDNERAITAFLDHYRANIAVMSEPFPGMIVVLEQLRREGCRLGVCTNKFHDFSVALLRALDLERFFAVVAGGDSYPVRKPDGGHITRVAEALGGPLSEAVMVGDSGTDVAAARHAGVPVVAVSYGYTAVPPRELGADAVIDHATELPAALARLTPAWRS